MPSGIEANREAGQIKPTRFSDRATATLAGAEIESCFCAPALDGTAGIGCEPDDGAEQQLILPPQSQPAQTGCREHAGAGAAGNCTHTSTRLNHMADNRFTC